MNKELETLIENLQTQKDLSGLMVITYHENDQVPRCAAVGIPLQDIKAFHIGLATLILSSVGVSLNSAEQAPKPQVIL